MTYLQFHLVFILPPILALVLLQPRPMAGVGAGTAWRFIGLIGLIAFSYTILWDNFLVWRGVWSYGPERVLATVGYVPVEEYAFFLLQPVLTGLWFCAVRTKQPPSQEEPPLWLRPALVGGWLAVVAAGAAMLFGTRTLYMGLILAWAAPVLAGMAWIAAGKLWRARRAALVGIAVPTVYLWVADRTAIDLGIWDIADATSLGFDPLGLPIEEAVFFLVTNVLVVWGLVLFLPE